MVKDSKRELIPACGGKAMRSKRELKRNQPITVIQAFESYRAHLLSPE